MRSIWLWTSSHITFFVLLLAIMGLGVGLYVFWPHLPPLDTQIISCNGASKELRFSCYRSVLERHFSGDLSDFAGRADSLADRLFTEDDDAYAVFGTNCHTYYHALGDLIAEHTSEDDVHSIRICPYSCTGGCLMGFLKRKAFQASYDSDFLQTMYQACPDEGKSVCAHEMGHLLQDKYFGTVLQVVDQLTREKYGYTSMNSYSSQPTEPPDVNRPFEECARLVPQDLLGSCYEGVGHNMFLFMEFSPEGYTKAMHACDGVLGDRRDVCLGFLLHRIGINEAASLFIQNDFDGGNRVCHTAVEIVGRFDLAYQCYQGVGRGIGLFLLSEYPNIEHLSEGRFAEMQTLLKSKAQLCDDADPDYVKYCYDGFLHTDILNYFHKLGISDELP